MVVKRVIKEVPGASPGVEMDTVVVKVKEGVEDMDMEVVEEVGTGVGVVREAAVDLGAVVAMKQVTLKKETVMRVTKAKERDTVVEKVEVVEEVREEVEVVVDLGPVVAMKQVTLKKETDM